MTKEEYLIYDRDKLVETINSITSDLEDLKDRIEDSDVVIDYVPDTSIEKWKATVLNSIPNGASMKMRIDVEQFLDRIDCVY